jgi:hypothetical protein
MTGVLAALIAGVKRLPITIPSDWGLSSGSPGANVTSSAKTLTVPGRNPGNISFSVSGAAAFYSKNGGAYTSLADGAVIAFADDDTLAFRYTAPSGESSSCSVIATDATTGAKIGEADMFAVYIPPP